MVRLMQTYNPSHDKLFCLHPLHAELWISGGPCFIDHICSAYAEHMCSIWPPYDQHIGYLFLVYTYMDFYCITLSIYFIFNMSKGR